MNIAQAIMALNENAIPLENFIVQDAGDGPYISHWDESLGPLPTEEQLAEGWQLHLKNQRKAEIFARLSAIDLETVRPLRAVTAGAGTEYDTNKLAALEAEAKELRDELATL